MHVNVAKPINFLTNKVSKPFTQFNWRYVSTNETEKNYKILKVKKFKWV
jgi:hypothetical protein